MTYPPHLLEEEPVQQVSSLLMLFPSTLYCYKLCNNVVLCHFLQNGQISHYNSPKWPPCETELWGFFFVRLKKKKTTLLFSIQYTFISETNIRTQRLINLSKIDIL